MAIFKNTFVVVFSADGVEKVSQQQLLYHELLGQDNVDIMYFYH